MSHWHFLAVKLFLNILSKLLKCRVTSAQHLLAERLVNIVEFWQKKLSTQKKI